MFGALKILFKDILQKKKILHLFLYIYLRISLDLIFLIYQNIS